ncbi:HAD-IIIC family phosphatase [Salinisphaera sp.]|uniref:HAD-IIIC family phosphatase n=1 Tax=Salinisphaera sp. TaxID=1914330 RepID=UPI002D7A16D9|nr:HAD-IIIC family phosphatase [Salinisphaera sp.]HET7314095.1 HAD-IIIC family phosphatase [Salinisphaera sp.]
MDTAAQTTALEDAPRILREELAAGELSTARVERGYKRIAALQLPVDLKVAWVGNHTLEPALRYAAVSAFVHGVVLGSHAGGYNQHVQAVLDPGSALHAYAPDAIVISLFLRALAPSLVSGGAALSAEMRKTEAQRVLEHVEQWVEAAKTNTQAALMVCNFPRHSVTGLGLADLRSPVSSAALIGWLNDNLAAAYRDDPRVHVLDVDRAIANAGRQASWNPRMYHLAKIAWDGPGLQAAAQTIARALCALVTPAKKCLVLDLDNTLWGGVVGEDGIGGLKIETGDPVGEAFQEFQRVLLDIKARGVLLALVSKNNPEDVDEAFSTIDMPLSRADFAAWRVNWEHKPLNIESIAAELNIGVDSIVFVDDNPAECELVRQTLPEVEVIGLPRDPADYAELLQQSWSFDKLTLTEEDTRKTEQYLENAARTENLRTATDLSAYLENLGTSVEIGAAASKDLARLHQLFSKTNQFNLTTKRYTLVELKQFAESEEWLFEWIRVKDNFGDLGLVGAYLVNLSDKTPEIDSFILSCRALGREIETAAANRIKQKVFNSGAEALFARFAPTAKNRPAESFYESQGFDVIAENDTGEKRYRLDRAQARPRECAALTVTVTENH